MLQPDWPKLRDCWQREHRTMSRVCGEVASDGRATPPVGGWGIICTGELIFGEFDPEWGSEGRKGGNRMVLSWTRLSGWAPWFLSLPQFYFKVMMIWLVKQERDRNMKQGNIQWLLNYFQAQCFFTLILPIRSTTYFPPSLADHACGRTYGLLLGAHSNNSVT